jgi:hypothetical protein
VVLLVPGGREGYTMSADELMTLTDLERRWKPPGATPGARRKWVLRRVKAWGIPHEAVVRNPRFLPAEVLRAEEKQMGRARR